MDINWNEITPAEDTTNREQEYKKITSGGYVMRVVSAEDMPDRECVLLTLDIAEGELANYDEEAEGRGFPYAYQKLYAYYRPKTQGQFRRMLDLFASENPKKFSVAKFKNDVSKLTGLLIGAVLDEDDYGEKFRLKMNYFKLTTLAKIRNGEFKVKHLPTERKDYLLKLAEQQREERRQEENGYTAATTNESDVPFF